MREDFNCSATRGSTCTSRVAMGGEGENVRGEGGGSWRSGELCAWLKAGEVISERFSNEMEWT